MKKHHVINFNCPKCNQPIQVDDSFAYQEGNCPFCGELVSIPAPSSPVLRPNLPHTSQNVTAAGTMKNKKAHTIGVVAIVLGVLSILVAWIPVLGLIAIPLAVVGGVLALIGVVQVALKRQGGWAMPLLGGGVCFIAIVLSLITTSTTSVAIKNASETIEEWRAAIKPTGAKPDAAEKK